jgi:phenylalanyl-tRNA synthetase beta chain
MAVLPPSYRLDLEREADLIEEVGRVYGLDRIAPRLPRVSKSLTEDLSGTEFGFLSKVRRFAAASGLREAVIYSFVGHADLDLLGIDRLAGVRGQSAVRGPECHAAHARAGLLLAVRHNLAQGNANLRLFEAARVYCADPDSPTTAREAARFGIVLHGSRHPEGWPWPKDEEVGYADLKGLVELLLRHLHLPAPTYTGMKPALARAPGGRALGTTRIGVLGQVSPDVADAFHARSELWLAELDCDAFARPGRGPKAQLHAVTKLPARAPRHHSGRAGR